MSEWRETTLGEVVEINPEATPRTWTRERTIRYVDIASVSAERGIDERNVTVTSFGDAPGRARRIIRSGDVLVSTVRPNLRAFAEVPPSLDGEVASTGFAVVRAGQGIEPGFVWCLVSSDAFVDSMVARCTGSNYPAIRGADVAEYPVSLPSLSEQRRIVDVMAAVDAQIEAVDEETAALQDVYGNSTGLLWQQRDGKPAPPRRLADVMALDLLRVPVLDSDAYMLAGVLNAGRGMIDKGVLRGSESAYAALNRLRAGQVVMRKLTAWEGPITVVPDAFDGFHASNEFPTFSLAGDVLPGYFAHVCRSPRLWQEMKQRVTGSVQRRKRLNPDQLLAVNLPIPALEQQCVVAKSLDAVLRQIETGQNEGRCLRAVRSNLLSGLLSGNVTLPESYDDRLAAAS